ncbi:serine protease 56 isoform X2 [Dryobates pubescens]|uniref:serine protease 56 isoform X2 n=1 Tax=Dryobates pubescens TaxID=118200 RepID=UPI0023B8EDEE|nr:serine protease 56 isoform X2 [Dryobates pubescens]
MERGEKRTWVSLLGVCLVPPVLLPLLPLLHLVGGAPLGQGLYPMPASVLQALSSRGTLVLEAALRSALLALEQALAEQQRQRGACGLCAPCLFPPCANITHHCPPPPVPLTVPPSCQDLLEAQALPDLLHRNWALSQACAPYQQLCPPEVAQHDCTPLSAQLCHHRLQECRMGASTLDPDVPAEVVMPGTRMSCRGQWWLEITSSTSQAWARGQCLSDASCLTLRSVDVGTHLTSLCNISSTSFCLLQFNPKTFHGDLALLELALPLALSPTVSPVCLPNGPTEPSPGTTCYIAGWGSLYEEGPAANVVMEARVPLLSQETCRGALGRDLLTSTMFCAGYLSGGIDSCQGDSGGPLACQDPSSHRFVLYGITSWGDGCGERGKPGVYTRVAAFVDWLSFQMDPAPGSREPSCFDLLALAQLPAEQQPLERARLCSFYNGSCRTPPGRAACARLAEETCHARTRRCELHSYAQTLVDLLQRAGDFIRNQFDFSFLTRTLPQLLGKIYGHLFPRRVRRNAPGLAVAGSQPSPTAEAPWRLPTKWGAGQPPPFAVLFKDVGPQLQDWVEALRTMVVGSTSAPTLDKRQLSREMWLFLQGEEVVEELVGQGRAFLTQLQLELDLGTPLEATESRRAPGELAETLRQSLAGSAPREKRELAPTELPGVEEEEADTGRACPGLKESAVRVGAVRELYAWVLRVPEAELAMTFQEVSAPPGCPEPPTLAARWCHPTARSHCPAMLLAPVRLTALSSPCRSWWTWAPKTPRGCTGRRCAPRWAAAPQPSPAWWGWRATPWPAACPASSLWHLRHSKHNGTPAAPCQRGGGAMGQGFLMSFKHRFLPSSRSSTLLSLIMPQSLSSHQRCPVPLEQLVDGRHLDLLS